MLSSATTSAAERGGRPREAPPCSLARRPYGWLGSFRAMASPCEVHLGGVGRRKAAGILEIVQAEAMRIETKFSRYREGNIVDRINRSDGCHIAVDDETARLLDYAAELWTLSAGRFDITSGVLRRAWTFDGSDNVPDSDKVERLLGRVGWQRVDWRRPTLRMQPGMEIDFGGIGKEYAVDRAAELVRGEVESCLINFGGDLLALGPPPAGEHGSAGWTVGVESLAGGTAAKRISLTEGALATSGDARRFVLRGGHRYGHILDARTGWPVDNAPRSVTVLASTCTQAGMLATFAMLMGGEAESFLEAQGVRFWCQR